MYAPCILPVRGTQKLILKKNPSVLMENRAKRLATFLEEKKKEKSLLRAGTIALKNVFFP